MYEKFQRYFFIFCYVLFCVALIGISLDNLTHINGAIAYAQYKGIWMADVGTTAIQIWLGIAGLFILTGYKRREGLLMYLIFLVVVTPFMHNFWTISDPNMYIVELKFFEVNVIMFALTGMVYIMAKNWPYTVKNLLPE